MHACSRAAYAGGHCPRPGPTHGRHCWLRLWRRLLLWRLLEKRVVHLGDHLLHPQARALARARLARRQQPRLARDSGARCCRAGRRWRGGRCRCRRRRCSSCAVAGGRRRGRWGSGRGRGRCDASPEAGRCGLLRRQGGRPRLGRRGSTQLGGILLQLLAVQLGCARGVLGLDLVAAHLQQSMGRSMQGWLHGRRWGSSGAGALARDANRCIGACRARWHRTERPPRTSSQPCCLKKVRARWLPPTAISRS